MAGKMAYHHGDLRQALIDGAIGLIAEQDVNSLSLREVARRVGVSHVAPYRHFPDKESVAIAHPSHYRVMFRGCPGAPLPHPQLAQAGGQAFQVLLERIEGGQAAGGVRSQDTMQLAWVAWSMVHGSALLLMDGLLPVSQPEEVERLAEFVTQTLIVGLAR